MSESGSVTWPSPAWPLWRFNWVLANSPDAEGIAILSAYYRNHQVFYKASLPSLRVQYDHGCGPYKDPLNYDTAQPINGSSRVKAYWVISAGAFGVAVEAFYRIGQYRLTQRWTFWMDGRVSPRLYSAGLQCNDDHRHHTYWRFDFDIDGASNDIAFEYNTTTPNTGWGPGWHVKQVEMSRVKNPATLRSWAVMDRGSGRGYHLVTGSNDGRADAFSTRDVWFMQYRGSEDRHGRQGGASDDGLAAYLNPGQSIAGTDLVIWYAGHLAHHADPDNADEWHSCGPTLVPFRW